MAVIDAYIPGWTSSANMRRARVLVAFHGTPCAWAALRHGVAVAVEQRALLTVAMVCAQPRFTDTGPLLPCVSFPYEYDQEATRILAGAIEVVPPDVSVVSVLLRGGVASAIAAHAVREGHDLVVMGRGKRRFRRAIDPRSRRARRSRWSPSMRTRSGEACSRSSMPSPSRTPRVRCGRGGDAADERSSRRCRRRRSDREDARHPPAWTSCS